MKRHWRIEDSGWFSTGTDRQHSVSIGTPFCPWHSGQQGTLDHLEQVGQALLAYVRQQRRKQPGPAEEGESK